MPTTDEYIGLLYKKYLGSVAGYPNRNYLSDIAIYGRQRILQRQIYQKSVPTLIPGTSSTITTITYHPAWNSSTNTVINNRIWAGGAITGITTLSNLGSRKVGTTTSDVSDSTVYDYLVYHQDVVLIMENPGISYSCNNVTQNINYLSDQVPYNVSTNIGAGSYNPTIKIWTSSGGGFSPQEALNDGPSRQWVMDQDAGVLTFYGTPINTSTQYVTASYWRYEGPFGGGSVVSGGGGDGTFTMPAIIDGGTSLNTGYPT